MPEIIFKGKVHVCDQARETPRWLRVAATIGRLVLNPPLSTLKDVERNGHGR